jgi:hypothetical protein
MNKKLPDLIEALDRAADAYRNAAYAEMESAGSIYTIYQFVKESYAIGSKREKIKRLQNNS